VAGLGGPYLLFFVPKGSGGGAGGQAAKDALGNDVKTNAWLATHQKGDRSLTQGLKVRLQCYFSSDRVQLFMSECTENGQAAAVDGDTPDVWQRSSVMMSK
jgi:hypothetical protein